VARPWITCCSTASGVWGKTTLANIIANELGCIFSRRPLHCCRSKHLTAIITNMQDKQVLFIDEIHRLQPVLEELLYSAWKTTSSTSYWAGTLGPHPHAGVKPFTFVGAHPPGTG